MNNIGWMRLVVEKRVSCMIDEFLLYISNNMPEEKDVMMRIQGRSRDDVVVILVHAMMIELGHSENSARDTRNAVIRKSKPLRGANTFDNSNERKKAMET